MILDENNGYDNKITNIMKKKTSGGQQQDFMGKYFPNISTNENGTFPIMFY